MHAFLAPGSLSMVKIGRMRVLIFNFNCEREHFILSIYLTSRDCQLNQPPTFPLLGFFSRRNLCSHLRRGRGGNSYRSLRVLMHGTLASGPPYTYINIQLAIRQIFKPKSCL